VALSDQSPVGSKPEGKPKRFYTTGEVAEMFGVTRRTVINWCDRGRIPSILTPGGQRRIPVTAFLTSPEDEAERQTIKARLAAKAAGQPIPSGDDIAAEIRARRQG
jgi:excisionase family DNA binding protein